MAARKRESMQAKLLEVDVSARAPGDVIVPTTTTFVAWMSQRHRSGDPHDTGNAIAYQPTVAAWMAATRNTKITPVTTLPLGLAIMLYNMFADGVSAEARLLDAAPVLKAAAKPPCHPSAQMMSHPIAREVVRSGVALAEQVRPELQVPFAFLMGRDVVKLAIG